MQTESAADVEHAGVVWGRYIPSFMIALGGLLCSNRRGPHYDDEVGPTYKKVPLTTAIPPHRMKMKCIGPH